MEIYRRNVRERVRGRVKKRGIVWVGGRRGIIDCLWRDMGYKMYNILIKNSINNRDNTNNTNNINSTNSINISKIIHQNNNK